MTTIAPTFAGGASGGSVRLAEILPLVDVDQLIEQFEALHRGASGAMCLVRRDADVRVEHTLHTWAEMVPAGQPNPGMDAEMRRVWQRCLADADHRWNLYVALATFNLPTERSRDGKPPTYKRQARYVNSVSGFYADLDVKSDVEGRFHSREELDAFLAKLPPPSMLVDSGSGGAHAYWITTERLPGGVATQRALSGWHDYVQELAGSVIVDNVMEPARFLRTAGSVRWSKPEELASGWPAFTRVQLRFADGPRYDARELTELARQAYRRGEDRRRALREEFGEDRRRSIEYLESRGLERTSRDYIERRFNAQQDWAVLLERAGWTLVRDGRDGSGHASDHRTWRRPGLPDTAHSSASTDFGDSGLMTLYSNDPQVSALADPTVPTTRFRSTTKYRFALLALYRGDEEALVLDIHANGGTL